MIAHGVNGRGKCPCSTTGSNGSGPGITHQNCAERNFTLSAVVMLTDYTRLSLVEAIGTIDCSPA